MPRPRSSSRGAARSTASSATSRCSSATAPRQDRATRSLAELDLFYRLGWRGRVFFVDDNLIGNRRYLKEELLPAIIEWRKGKSGMPFNTEASINLADDAELMQLMVEAGFDGVFVGIETPEESSLAECNKKQNVGPRPGGRTSSASSAPGSRCRAASSSASTATPRPSSSGRSTSSSAAASSPPWSGCCRRRLRPGCGSGWRPRGGWSATRRATTWRPAPTSCPGCRSKRFAEGYRGVVAHLYMPEHYYARACTFLREVKPPKFERPRSTRAYVPAFFRSVGRLGIVGKERTAVLEAVPLDAGPPAQAAAARHHARDLRLPLPAAVRSALAASLRVRPGRRMRPLCAS